MANKRINDIQERLATAKENKIPVAERQRMRNQVSALQSRLKKKMEVIFLYELVNKNDDKIETLFGILKESLKGEKKLLGKITQQIRDAYPVEAEEGNKPTKRTKSSSDQV